MHSSEFPGGWAYDTGLAGTDIRVHGAGYLRASVGADLGALPRERHGAAERATQPLRYLSERISHARAWMKTHYPITNQAAALVVAVCVFAGSVQAHHSFAMYDVNKTYVMTGVVVRVDPNPNHLQIFFAPLNNARDQVIRDNKNEPVVWTV